MLGKARADWAPPRSPTPLTKPVAASATNQATSTPDIVKLGRVMAAMDKDALPNLLEDKQAEESSTDLLIDKPAFLVDDKARARTLAVNLMMVPLVKTGKPIWGELAIGARAVGYFSKKVASAIAIQRVKEVSKSGAAEYVPLPTTFASKEAWETYVTAGRAHLHKIAEYPAYQPYLGQLLEAHKVFNTLAGWWPRCFTRARPSSSSLACS